MSEGASIVPSPLAQGPTDPFIRAYFQIDPTGHVTLPTLPDGDLDVADRQRAVSDHGIQKDLQLAARTSTCMPSLQHGKQQPHYEVMEADAYRQNMQATQIYADLKNGSNLVRMAMSPMDGKQEKVTIAVGEFEWCSLQTSNGQNLVAMRDVTTPDGILVQGFVISNEAVTESLKNAALPARFLPNANFGAYVAPARLEGAGWYIVVSAAKEFDAARLRVHRSETNFWNFFWRAWGGGYCGAVCGDTGMADGATRASALAICGVRRARTADTARRPSYV